MLMKSGHPILKPPAHDVTARLVPQLHGGWFFHGHCRCGEQTHGDTLTRAAAEDAVYRSLRCYPATSRVQFQELHRHASSVALLRQYRPTATPVLSPYGHVELPTKSGPADVSVDGSVDAHGAGMAAVTGCGWVSLYRLQNEPGFNTTVAETLAVCAGLDMLPIGSVGTIWCDNRTVVDQINQWFTHGFADRRPSWLAPQTYGSLSTLLHDRYMRVRWRPRNSTPALAMADTLAKLARRKNFNGCRAAEILAWVRADDTAEDSRVRYPYMTTDGAPV